MLPILFFLTILLLLIAAACLCLLKSENKIMVSYTVLVIGLSITLAFLRCYFLALVNFIINFLIVITSINAYQIFQPVQIKSRALVNKYILFSCVFIILVFLLYSYNNAFYKKMVSFDAGLAADELAAWVSPDIQFVVIIFSFFILAHIITIIALMRNKQ